MTSCRNLKMQEEVVEYNGARVLCGLGRGEWLPWGGAYYEPLTGASCLGFLSTDPKHY